MVRIIAAFPAIEGLWTDAKVATGEPSIVTVRMVVIEPFKSVPGFP